MHSNNHTNNDKISNESHTTNQTKSICCKHTSGSIPCWGWPLLCFLSPFLKQHMCAIILAACHRRAQTSPRPLPLSSPRSLGEQAASQQGLCSLHLWVGHRQRERENVSVSVSVSVCVAHTLTYLNSLTHLSISRSVSSRRWSYAPLPSENEAQACAHVCIYPSTTLTHSHKHKHSHTHTNTHSHTLSLFLPLNARTMCATGKTSGSGSCTVPPVAECSCCVAAPANITKEAKPCTHTHIHKR